MSKFKDTLTKNLDSSGIIYNEKQLKDCEEYYTHVIEANKRTNLTRITDEEQAAYKHFADAIKLLSFVDLSKNCRVIDVGTGAGFPGIPLKLLRPDIELTLLDSSNRKTDFIKTAANAMGLDVAVLCERAEEAAKTDIRESFDIVVSRAVASLLVLCELCVPFLRVGGIFAAWKGESYKTELEDAKNALSTLSCPLTGCYSVGKGAIITMEKQKPTRDIYPRRFAKIKSEPL